MSKPINATGQCLCKKVTISATEFAPHVDACHCAICRKWSGSSLLAVDCGQNVSFDGQEHISVFDSSEWAERGFCQHCGTHLFYRLKQNQQYIVPIGLFDVDAHFDFTTQIFIEQKPDYYEFANQTKNMTGEEIFAAFTSEK
jgi:hypothetical protein